MKRVSNYLKMRVLGALEYAPGETMHARYRDVAAMTFQDEDGLPVRFTWRTIQTWWYYYRKHGITHAPERADKGTIRKVSPERLLEAIEQVMPSFHHKRVNIAEVYRACIQRGLLQRTQIAPNTFRRAVNRFDLLKPAGDQSPKARLAFAKAHANDMWQGDTLHQLNAEFTRWLEDTYHQRLHATLGMKPIDRFGLDIPRIRHLSDNPFCDELFLLESTRKVRADNTFSYNTRRYEAPRDLRHTTITIRHHRPDLHFPPIVYQDGVRLGEAVLLDMVANDRRPDIENDF